MFQKLNLGVLALSLTGLTMNVASAAEPTVHQVSGEVSCQNQSLAVVNGNYLSAIVQGDTVRVYERDMCFASPSACKAWLDNLDTVFALGPAKGQCTTRI